MITKFKSHLLFSFLFTCIFIQSGNSLAIPCKTFDVPNAPYIAGNSIATHNTASTGNEVVAKEEIANQTRSGNADCANSPAKKPELTTKTYDYLKENIVTLFDSKYISPQEDIDSAIKTLEETFFVSKDGSENGMEKMNNRRSFASEVSAEAYALSQQLRPLYKEDMQALTSIDAKGCNQTQSNAMMNRNIKAQIKMLATQILIQIVQMEVDTVQQFIKESPTLISLEETPTGGEKK